MKQNRAILKLFGGLYLSDTEKVNALINDFILAGGNFDI